jgi:hypothetical protein
MTSPSPWVVGTKVVFILSQKSLKYKQFSYPFIPLSPNPSPVNGRREKSPSPTCGRGVGERENVQETERLPIFVTPDNIP